MITYDGVCKRVNDQNHYYYLLLQWGLKKQNTKVRYTVSKLKIGTFSVLSQSWAPIRLLPKVPDPFCLTFLIDTLWREFIRKKNKQTHGILESGNEIAIDLQHFFECRAHHRASSLLLFTVVVVQTIDQILRPWRSGRERRIDQHLQGQTINKSINKWNIDYLLARKEAKKIHKQWHNID